MHCDCVGSDATSSTVRTAPRDSPFSWIVTFGLARSRPIFLGIRWPCSMPGELRGGDRPRPCRARMLPQGEPTWHLRGLHSIPQRSFHRVAAGVWSAPRSSLLGIFLSCIPCLCLLLRCARSAGPSGPRPTVGGGPSARSAATRSSCRYLKLPRRCSSAIFLPMPMPRLRCGMAASCVHGLLTLQVVWELHTRQSATAHAT